jgi:glutamate dehydrogenase (NAD(P)+)
MTALHRLGMPAFAEALRAANIRRFHLVWDDQRQTVVPSHAFVAPLAELLESDTRDFDRHEGFFVEVGDSGALHGACIHRTCRGQGAGGVRNWRYDCVEDYLRDGLRLARGMTHKNALAGLWWGGGKGVMTAPKGIEPAERRRVYEEYGAFITTLRGCYVTAEDVGTSVEDMAAIFATTRFTTCIPTALGGSGNPSVPTARGVRCGIEAALEHRGMGGIAGKRFAVQGLGHVGEPLVRMLLEAGAAHIVGSDIDPTMERLSSDRLEVRIVARGDNSILAEAADVVAPCAVGGLLHEGTIGTITAPIVCGAANNQLRDPDADDRRLAAAGISYVPDFLVNRMGIVHCADEAVGYVDDDPAFDAHLGRDHDNSIHALTLHVLETSQRTGEPPGAVALAMAEARSLELHPLWGHRGKRIIRSLVARGWANGTQAADS